MKKRLQKKARERFQNISEEEKKKPEYGLERYKNHSEDEKQNLVEHRKNIIDREKMVYFNYKKVF